jgi:small subunit ribosomal protein S5
MNRFRREQQEKEFEERVIQVNRVSKKTTGGNKIGFTSLVVIGDKKGRVGGALGKAPDVVSGIRKGVSQAKKNLINVPLHENRTIPHRIELKYGASRIMLKPAPKGSGIIAGGAVRVVLELAGVRDVVGKMKGTRNKITNVYATMEALKKLRTQKRSQS